MRVEFQTNWRELVPVDLGRMQLRRRAGSGRGTGAEGIEDNLLAMLHQGRDIPPQGGQGGLGLGAVEGCGRGGGDGGLAGGLQAGEVGLEIRGVGEGVTQVGADLWRQGQAVIAAGEGLPQLVQAQGGADGGGVQQERKRQHDDQRQTGLVAAGGCRSLQAFQCRQSGARGQGEDRVGCGARGQAVAGDPCGDKEEKHSWRAPCGG